jgi:flagellar assembly protein FliH
MAISTYEFAPLEGTAPRQAEDVLTAAWAEAEHVRAQAHAEGFAAGHAAGLELAAQQAATALAALSGAAGALDAQRAGAVSVLQEQAAELALAIAEHVLSGAIDVDRGRVVDVCRGALRRLSDRSKVTVLVHPDDLETLAPQVDTLTAELGGIERFEVQADRRIDPGGVSVRTDHGEIDATIATQLTAVREIVIASLSDGRDG